MGSTGGMGGDGGCAGDIGALALRTLYATMPEHDPSSGGLHSTETVSVVGAPV